MVGSQKPGKRAALSPERVMSSGLRLQGPGLRRGEGAEGAAGAAALRAAAAGGAAAAAGAAGAEDARRASLGSLFLLCLSCGPFVFVGGGV